MEISHSTIWKHFESRAPQGHKNLFVCKCVFVHTCICVSLCVSCVCSTLSPGTSAMPPLSQFLASLLKNMLIQTNLLFLLCSSLPSSSLGMDWMRHTTTANVHHHSQGVWFSSSFFDFISLFWIISFPTEFQQKGRRSLSIRNSLRIVVSCMLF